MPLLLTVLRQRLGRGALALATAGLAGCASLLPADSDPLAVPVEVPSAWSALPSGVQARDSAELSAWWDRFEDPLLSAWVGRALAHHTSVRQAVAALQQSRAQRDVAIANQLPSVRASGSAQRSQVGDGTPGNTFRAGFDATWEPDVFGVRRQASAAADADVQAAAAAVAQARVSLAAEVAANAIELRGLEQRLRLSRDNLAKQEESLQLTEWRVQAGLASSLDLEQARAAVEQTRAALPALETSLQQALNALAVLTGQPPGALVQEWRRGARADVPRPPTDLTLTFPAETLRQRPDVQAAEQRVLAAWARTRQADASRYPNLSLGGSLGLNAPRLGDLLDLSSLTRSVVASVTASLFDGGAARAQVRAQAAALEQARLAHEAAVLNALQDVENALVALQGNRERVARLEAAAEAAGNAELLARQRYASGLVDYRTLLDTQRTLLSTQTELAAARTSWSNDHVRLYKALGGGWAAEPAEPPPQSPMTEPSAAQS